MKDHDLDKMLSNLARRPIPSAPANLSAAVWGAICARDRVLKIQQKEAVMVSGFATKQTEAKESMTEKENKSKSPSIKALMTRTTRPTHQEIKACAYFIYVHEGRPEGRAFDYWLQPELQLVVTRMHDAVEEGGGAAESEISG